VFDAASDILALATRQSLSEFAGSDEGIEPELTETTKAAFERATAKLLKADLRGSYCRVGWYGDEDEVNIVVTHGAVVTTTPAIKDGVEQVISFRGAEHSVLAYQTETGRLKIGGVPKAQRAAIAEIFACSMLNRPEFFAGTESQNLYTLEPIEKKGFAFMLDLPSIPASGARRSSRFRSRKQRHPKVPPRSVVPGPLPFAIAGTPWRGWSSCPNSSPLVRTGIGSATSSSVSASTSARASWPGSPSS
jgi:hypothetical protein